MLSLLRDTRRYAEYLRLLQDRWVLLQCTMPWTAEKGNARIAYEDVAGAFDEFVAELESQLPADVVDRMDRIAYRAVYGKGA